MFPRFVELTHGTSGLLLAFLSIQIPMLVGLIRSRARLAHLALSPVPAVALTLVMGIVMAVLAPLLTPRQPQPVQAAVLETLAGFDQPAVPGLVIEAWPGLSPRLRATAAETLFARPAWVAAFLDAVEQGKVKPGDVDPARVNLLQASGDERVRARARAMFAGARLGKRADVVLLKRDSYALLFFLLAQRQLIRGFTGGIKT